MISTALDTKMGFAILRLREGLDYSEIIQEDSDEIISDLTRQDSTNSKNENEKTFLITVF